MSGTDAFNRNYAYDDDNRITQKVHENGMIYNFSYLANTHAVSSIDVVNGAGISRIDYAYDEYGNMRTKEVFNGASLTESIVYSYDEENRLTKIDDSLTELTFKYDNKGQRIKKVFEDEAGVIKENIYVNGFYTVADGQINKHISDGVNIIATKLDDSHDEIKYYHSNHLGSTAALSDRQGEAFQEYLYYPYGELWVKDQNVDDEEFDILFTGQHYDKESGLYYMNARYYDPDIGMFMRPDPAMDGLNHYAYANCNPIKYSDPTGCDTWLDAANNDIVEIIWNSIVSCGVSMIIQPLCIYFNIQNPGANGGGGPSIEGGGSVSIGSSASSSTNTSSSPITTQSSSDECDSSDYGSDIYGDKDNEDVSSNDINNNILLTSLGSDIAFNINDNDDGLVEVSIAIHKVAGLNHHSCIIIVINSNSKYYNDNGRFKDLGKTGLKYATIGSGPDFSIGRDKLISGINRERDVMLNNKVEYIPLVLNNEFCIKNKYRFNSMNDLVDKLFELRTNYKKNNVKYNYSIEYDLRPSSNNDGYNSNSFTSGLLKAAGFYNIPTPNHLVPGWDKPVPQYMYAY